MRGGRDSSLTGTVHLGGFAKPKQHQAFRVPREALQCFLRLASTKKLPIAVCLYLRGGRDSNPQPPT